MQIRPAQTLGFVFAPETGQIDRIHRQENLSDTLASVENCSRPRRVGGFPFVPAAPLR